MSEELPTLVKPSADVLIRRAWALKCPRCGQGAMYVRGLTMNERCPACGLRYEREPGFFLGAIYINYGLTCLLMTFTYVFLRFGMDVQSKSLIWIFSAFALLFPILMMRRARALWLAMDCLFDSTAFDVEPGSPTPAPASPAPSPASSAAAAPIHKPSVEPDAQGQAGSPPV